MWKILRMSPTVGLTSGTYYNERVLGSQVTQWDLHFINITMTPEGEEWVQ